MNKRKIKKAAYKAIVKDNKTHQETFDELRKTSSIDTETLADEVAKIPNSSKHNRLQTLRFIFIGTLGVIMFLRVLGVFSIISLKVMNPSILLVAVGLGLIVPVIGVYGALTARVELYRTTGILLVLSVVRSFTNGQVSADPINYLVLIPFAIAISLAFYIPTKLKTDYSKKVVKHEVDGKTKTSYQFIFDSNDLEADNELLDVN
jgi:hypothetical protein